jgi:small GTP-binding protein
VGKTSLISRYVVFPSQDHCFSHRYMSTLGVDFKLKELQIADKKVQVQIWDTAGQERFRNITTGYYRGANGIAIVYDVTSKPSFDTVATWIKESNKSAPENALHVLIANKTDMLNHRVVNESDGKLLSQQYSLYYFETSAKDDVGVNEVFDFMANKMFSNLSVSPDYLNMTAESLRKQAQQPERRYSEPVSYCRCCAG